SGELKPFVRRAQFHSQLCSVLILATDLENALVVARREVSLIDARQTQGRRRSNPASSDGLRLTCKSHIQSPSLGPDVHGLTAGVLETVLDSRPMEGVPPLLELDVGRRLR